MERKLSVRRKGISEKVNKIRQKPKEVNYPQFLSIWTVDKWQNMGPGNKRKHMS